VDLYLVIKIYMTMSHEPLKTDAPEGEFAPPNPPPGQQKSPVPCNPQAPLTFDCRLLIFLWRHLTLFNIAVIFIVVYVAFWLLAFVRLRNPSIQGRMQFAAEFVSLKETDPTAAARDVTETLARLKKEWPSFSFHFAGPMSPGATSVPVPVGSESEFIAEATRLSMARDGSYEFQAALQAFNASANNWYDHLEPELERRPDFAHDDQLRKGAAISLPHGPIDDLRHDAEDYLQNYRMFDGKFSAATEQVKLRPWLLFRFYDPKRYLLCQKLPFAFGTLLVACSLFLQFRFIDLSRLPGIGSKRLPVAKHSINADWPEVWVDATDKCLPRVEPELDLTGRILVKLVPTCRLKWWLPLSCLAATFIELILDVPGVRAEWIVNVPLLSVTAVAIVVVWSTLAEMGRWRFSDDGIRRASREYRSHILRPFVLGGAALLAATAWMVGYSLVVLPLGQAEVAREIAQIIIGLVTILLLVRVGYQIHREELRSRGSWKTSDQEEEALGAEKVGLFDALLPHLDENMIKALLLAIVPLASIVESLFG
jgi:hypothetical protein